MRSILAFVRTTLVGGLLYLIPIVVVIAIVGKALQISRQIAPPVLRAVEALHLGGILTPQVVAILLILLFCFATGLFARAAVAKRVGSALESKVLANLPGYQFIKSVGENLAGVETSSVREPVMVRIEDAWQIAFVVDHLDDGHLAVYVPGVPEARAGSLYFMTPDRVKHLTIPLKSLLQTLRRMGVGSKELLPGGVGSPL